VCDVREQRRWSQILLGSVQWQDKSEIEEILFEHKETLGFVYFFTVWVVKHWNMLPGEAAERPSLQVLKT